MSEDYKAGQALVEEGEYEPVQRGVQQLLEVARRHKIMNPGAYVGGGWMNVCMWVHRWGR